MEAPSASPYYPGVSMAPGDLIAGVPHTVFSGGAQFLKVGRSDVESSRMRVLIVGQ